MPAAAVTNAASELVVAKQQVKVLEAQLQTMREFQGSVLDTIYWALGGVFLLLGVIVGVGWWSNFKVYERDKDSMRAALMAEISIKAAEHGVALRTNTDSAAEEILAKTTTTLKEMIMPMRANIIVIEGQILSMDLRRLKKEMEDASTPSIALTKAIGTLELCTKKAESEVPNIINFMLRKLTEGGKFTASEITRANAIIDSLPPKYAALNDRLRQQLVASEIFQLPAMPS